MLYIRTLYSVALSGDTGVEKMSLSQTFYTGKKKIFFFFFSRMEFLNKLKKIAPLAPLAPPPLLFLNISPLFTFLR